MIAMVDYGVGNLFSLKSSLAHLGLEAVVTADPARLRAADRIILPGVGAFGDAMEKLTATGLVPVIKEEARKKPLLGICLGMQLLFEQSLEYGVHQGLGLLEGSVVPMEGVLPAELKIPHIGWNALHLVQKDCPLFAGIREGDYVYFVHSYYLQAKEKEIVKASTEYSTHIHASVEQGNIFACQFHPEKRSADRAVQSGGIP